KLLGVTGAGILRQIADLTGAIDEPTGRRGLARKGLGERRLAGTVASAQTDLVTAIAPDIDTLHEEACATPDFEVAHIQHRGSPLLRSSRRHGQGEGQPTILLGMTIPTLALGGPTLIDRVVSRGLVNDLLLIGAGAALTAGLAQVAVP